MGLMRTKKRDDDLESLIHAAEARVTVGGDGGNSGSDDDSANNANTVDDNAAAARTGDSAGNRDDSRDGSTVSGTTVDPEQPIHRTWGELNIGFNTDVITDTGEASNPYVTTSGEELTVGLIPEHLGETMDEEDGEPENDEFTAIDAVVSMARGDNNGSIDRDSSAPIVSTGGTANKSAADSVHSRANSMLNDDKYQSTDERVNAFLNGLSNDELGISKYTTHRKQHETIVDENDPHKARTAAMDELMHGRLNGSRSNAAADDYRAHASAKAKHWNSTASYGATWILLLVLGAIIVIVNLFNPQLPIPGIGVINTVIGVAVMAFSWSFLRAWDTDPEIPAPTAPTASNAPTVNTDNTADK